MSLGGYRTALALCALVGVAMSMPIAGDTLITNARVLTMVDGPRYLDATVLVRGTDIAAVQSAPGNPAEDTEVVDAAGGYLIPGLVEMHAHVPVEKTFMNSPRIAMAS